MRRAVLIGLGLLIPGIAEGQVELREAPCSSCELRVTDLRLLTGPEVLGEPMATAVFGDGRVAMVFFQPSDEIWMFSASGPGATSRFPTGTGPGEVRNVAALALLPGDTLVVADTGNRRLSLFMPDGTHVRSQALPVMARDLLLALSSSRFVVAGMGMTEETMQRPLHLLEHGQILRSIGHLRGDFNPSIPYQTMRSGALLERQQFVTVPRTAYELTLWNSDGSSEAQYIREVDWFDPYVERQPIRPENELDSWFSGVGYLGDAVLLAVIHVPTDDWRDHLGQPESSSTGGISYPDWNLGEMYETRLEVIDLDAGEIVASETLDGTLSLAGDDVLVRYEESDIGVPSIQLLQVHWAR